MWFDIGDCPRVKVAVCGSTKLGCSLYTIEFVVGMFSQGLIVDYDSSILLTLIFSIILELFDGRLYCCLLENAILEFLEWLVPTILLP